MEFMLDTLNLDEIKKWSEILPLAGVTSNPTIAKREGSINFFERIKDVRELIGSAPSIHVQVISQDFEGILRMLMKFVDKQEMIYLSKYLLLRLGYVQ